MKTFSRKNNEQKKENLLISQNSTNIRGVGTIYTLLYHYLFNALRVCELLVY